MQSDKQIDITVVGTGLVPVRKGNEQSQKL